MKLSGGYLEVLPNHLNPRTYGSNPINVHFFNVIYGHLSELIHDRKHVQ